MFRRLIASALIAFAPLPAAAAEWPQLVYSQDFSRDSGLDTSFWTVETGFFRNKEEQYYQPANVSVQGRALVLEGRAETVANAGFDPAAVDWPANLRTAAYTSGSIVTRDAFTYGIVEVVARLPQSPGTWPAIWTVFEGAGPYREIDLVEAVGNSPNTIWSTVHAGPDVARLEHWNKETAFPGLPDAFHIYRLEWRPHAIVVSLDGRELLRVDPSIAARNGIDPLRLPMRLRINLALGGSWGGRIDPQALPARLEVRSIKVWRLPS